MLALLRLVFGFALFSVFAKAIEVAGPMPTTEGTTDAGYLALAVVLGIANAVVWAPLVGRWMADPLTGAFTTGHPEDLRNRVVQFVHKLGARGWRRAALLFAFLEGVRHPDLPAAFVLGLKHAQPGSWLEGVFAREVWRFDHAENCLRAWKILRQRGGDPGAHRRAEVNLLILSQTREKGPDPEALKVTPAPPAEAPRRNLRIQLFDGASGSGSGVEPDARRPVPAPPGEPLAARKEQEPAPAPATEREPQTPTPAGRRPGLLTWRQRLRVLMTGRLNDDASEGPGGSASPD